MIQYWIIGFLVSGAVYASLFGIQWEQQKQEALIRKNLLGLYQRTAPLRTKINRWRVWQQASQLELSKQSLWMIGWISSMLALGFAYFFLDNFFLSVPLAAATGVMAVVAWVRWNFSRRQVTLRDVFLDQVIPLGIQALGAINDLGAFFPIAAESIDHLIVKRFFLLLHQSWRSRGMAPEEAFYEELKKWNITELTQLGAITLLSTNRQVELSSIWLEYHTLVTNDLQRRKEASAKTYGARNSALGFVGMVGILFLVGAKLGSRWLTPAITHSLYLIFALLAAIAWWIWKQKDAMDV